MQEMCKVVLWVKPEIFLLRILDESVQKDFEIMFLCMLQEDSVQSTGKFQR